MWRVPSAGVSSTSSFGGLSPDLKPFGLFFLPNPTVIAALTDVSIGFQLTPLRKVPGTVIMADFSSNAHWRACGHKRGV